MSRIVQVFDPAMCCATGVCGPTVDPALARFAADLDWLKGEKVEVQRFNLSQQPEMFARNALVVKTMTDYGVECLPLVIVDGEIKAQGKYPSRAELASWVGIPVTPSLFSDAVAELVAIGASIVANCQPCFRMHYDKARKLGVSKEDMLAAVNVAQAVKTTPAESIMELVKRYLDIRHAGEDAPIRSGCCGTAASSDKKNGCC